MNETARSNGHHHPARRSTNGKQRKTQDTNQPARDPKGTQLEFDKNLAELPSMVDSSIVPSNSIINHTIDSTMDYINKGASALNHGIDMVVKYVTENGMAIAMLLLVAYFVRSSGALPREESLCDE